MFPSPKSSVTQVDSDLSEDHDSQGPPRARNPSRASNIQRNKRPREVTVAWVTVVRQAGLWRVRQHCHTLGAHTDLEVGWTHEGHTGIGTDG